jgi:hypothetical protein
MASSVHTDDNLCINMWILPNQVPYNFQCLIVLVRDGEQYLKVGVILSERRFEIFIQVQVKAFQRS